MNDAEAWDRFWGSGRIEDYLTYTRNGQSPDINPAEMVAMSNAAELSGIGDANMVGMNNMATLSRLDDINAHSGIRDLAEPAE